MKQCKINGCNNKVLARELCSRHYKEDRRKNNKEKCTVEGCNNAVIAKGLCNKHYAQYFKHGKILTRTRYDKNNISVDKSDNNIAYIDIYNIQGEISCKAIIDAEDIDKIKNIKWKGTNGGYVYNSKNSISLSQKIKGKPDKGHVIVHKDGNLLNYRKDNLVIIKSNRRNNKFKNNTSGRRGVYKLNNKGKFTGYFVSYITIDKQTIYLGKTKSFNKAVEKREEKEKELGWLKT